ncbi:hypothetical protein T31B1_18503 [Salinisphaera sp. T31B1]
MKARGLACSTRGAARIDKMAVLPDPSVAEQKPAARMDDRPVLLMLLDWRQLYHAAHPAYAFGLFYPAFE